MSLEPEPVTDDEGSKKGKPVERKVAVPGWDTPKGRQLVIFDNAPVVDVSSSDASRDDDFQAWVENGYRDPEPVEEPEILENDNVEVYSELEEVAFDTDKESDNDSESNNLHSIEDYTETQETPQEYYIGNTIIITNKESEPLG
mgnify:FL=1